MPDRLTVTDEGALASVVDAVSSKSAFSGTRNGGEYGKN